MKGNDLKTIKCIDKNGKEKEIPITNRAGIRITKNDNSKTTFYFNTLLNKDSSIVGSKTHFFNDKVKPIKLSDISKEEIIEPIDINIQQPPLGLVKWCIRKVTWLV